MQMRWNRIEEGERDRRKSILQKFLNIQFQTLTFINAIHSTMDTPIKYTFINKIIRTQTHISLIIKLFYGGEFGVE